MSRSGDENFKEGGNSFEGYCLPGEMANQRMELLKQV
jgi:hypothetical protein